jgi:hypothetical protein
MRLLTVILLLMTSAHAAWFSDDDKPKTTTTQDHKTYTLKLAETCVDCSHVLTVRSHCLLGVAVLV